MKGIFTKVTALLLIVWYSMSIIGFGVHTCSGSGKSFVVTFVEGFACEDIHPEHHCSKGACCSHSHASHHEESQQSVKSKSCCTSDYQVLALTGTVSDDKNGADYQDYPVLHISHGQYDHLADVFKSRIIIRDSGYISESWRMPDMQAALSVWRI